MKFSHQRWRDRRVCSQPRPSTLRVPLGAAPALKTAAFRRPARRSSGWCCFVQGTTNWGETPDVGRPNERATAASVSRSGEAIHTAERLALRWLEVMTRAVWEAGLCPLLTQHAKMGIAHAVPTARGSLSGGRCAACLASTSQPRFRSRARGAKCSGSRSRWGTPSRSTWSHAIGRTPAQAALTSVVLSWGAP